MTNAEIAQAIVAAIGGRENLCSLENCMTRVRMALEDMSLCDLETLRNLEDVLGIVADGGDVQIVVGTGKSIKITREMEAITGFVAREVDEAKLLKQENAARSNIRVKNLLKKVALIFVPIIPAFVACGLFVALYEMISVFMPQIKESSFGAILNAVGYSIFIILPIVVGYNTAREFGGTPVVGAVLASILNAATLSDVSIFGIECQAGRGGVISVLVVAASGAILEKRLRKRIPDMFDLFLTPLLTVFIMTFAGIMVFQPIGGLISDTIGNFVGYIIYNVPALAGLAALVYLPLVMTGMHHGLIAVNAQLITDFGVTYLLPVTCMAGAGQVGAAFYVFLKTKNVRLKKICRNALPVGVLGIGEPLMWGVTIPLGRPFIASCLGGAIGGSAMAMMHVAAMIPELSGLQLALITSSPLRYLVGVVISYAAGFFFTMLFGFDDPT